MADFIIRIIVYQLSTDQPNEHVRSFDAYAYQKTEFSFDAIRVFIDSKNRFVSLMSLTFTS